MPDLLPIDQIKTEFIQALKDNVTLLLTADPGAGKSTRLPLWLLDKQAALNGKIYLLQPRRLAVKNVATFLAQQLNEPLGKTIGYRLRHESKVSSTTQLEVVTEGVLVQIMQNDPELTGVSMVIIDEFHERSLQADLAFALARDIQQGLRDDLKLLLMSATLASETLKHSLPDAYYLSSQGRSFAVSVDYQPYQNIRLWRAHILSVIKHSMANFSGSVLVFLPGSGDIKYLADQLAELSNAQLIICPLYGELNLAQQQQAIFPCDEGVRKIVLATNIAETSLTIEGIELVIDSGLEKVAVYDEQTLANKLVQRNIAKSSAIQRMGRAGRIAAGHCIRLYSQEEFNRRALHNSLAIHQADILPVVIEAARWGVTQLSDLPLLDYPRDTIEDNAWQTLQKIAVVDDKKRLTSHGEKVAKLVCHARFAHMIIIAQQLEKQYQCQGLSYLACLLSALLEERDIFNREQAQYHCDIRPRITSVLANKKQYQPIIMQADKLARQVHCDKHAELPLEYIGVLLFLAFPERLAKKRSKHGEYLASYGKGVFISEQDALANETMIVAAHLSQYQQTLTVRLAAAIDLQQLIDWQLIRLTEQQQLHYDDKTQRIQAVSQTVFDAIVIEEKPNKGLLSDKAVFCQWQQQIVKQGLSFLSWKKDDILLLARWRWLNKAQNTVVFPDVSQASLVDSLSTWLKPFLRGITSKVQLDKLNLSDILWALLDYQQQQQFQTMAPSYFTGPTGRKCPIRYSLEHPPIVSLPMQEVYGIHTSPSVGDKSSPINLTLELLSPAQRPIQITADLAGFWQGSYKSVQKDMKAQYPKHYWPDDPANAKPTNKTKRHMKAQ
ncbi:ATP-dependent helicase HrpB [Colwelliaceae bacterium 6441]